VTETQVSSWASRKQIRPTVWTDPVAELKWKFCLPLKKTQEMVKITCKCAAEQKRSKCQLREITCTTYYHSYFLLNGVFMISFSCCRSRWHCSDKTHSRCMEIQLTRNVWEALHAVCVDLIQSFLQNQWFLLASHGYKNTFRDTQPSSNAMFQSLR